MSTRSFDDMFEQMENSVINSLNRTTSKLNGNNEIVDQLAAINNNLEALTAALMLQTKQLEQLNKQVNNMYDPSTDSLKVKQQ